MPGNRRTRIDLRTAGTPDPVVELHGDRDDDLAAPVDQPGVGLVPEASGRPARRHP